MVQDGRFLETSHKLISYISNLAAELKYIANGPAFFEASTMKYIDTHNEKLHKKSRNC